METFLLVFPAKVIVYSIMETQIRNVSISWKNNTVHLGSSYSILYSIPLVSPDKNVPTHYSGQLKQELKCFCLFSPPDKEAFQTASKGLTEKLSLL